MMFKVVLLSTLVYGCMAFAGIRHVVADKTKTEINAETVLKKSDTGTFVLTIKVLTILSISIRPYND